MGGVLNPQTANVDLLVDRIAERQFRGLWGSRDRDTGLLPNISSFADVMALNVTSSVIQMLPGAVDRGWVSQLEADEYVDQIVGTFHDIWDNVEGTGNGGYLPPRYVDRVTLLPNYALEESAVDASFLFLALHQYKALPTTTTALSNTIDGLLARFNFAAFGSPQGWKLAYLYPSSSFTAGTYDGYSGEIYTISLAAHLAPNNQVDIATHWNSGVNRVMDFLVDSDESHLVHSLTQFRRRFYSGYSHCLSTRAFGASTRTRTRRSRGIHIQMPYSTSARSIESSTNYRVPHSCNPTRATMAQAACTSSSAVTITLANRTCSCRGPLHSVCSVSPRLRPVGSGISWQKIYRARWG